MSNRIDAWRFLTTALLDETRLSRHEPGGELLVDERVWRDILSLANVHLVTPALWPALDNAGITSRVPSDAKDFLVATYETNLHRNRRLGTQLDEVIGALNGTDIVPLLLKGSAYLKAETYADAGARFSSDLDLLVPPEQLKRARSVLAKLGYRALGSPLDFEIHHHIQPLHRDGAEAAIELHLDALGFGSRQILPTAEILREATESSDRGVRYLEASPTHAVTLSFLHSEVSDRHLKKFLIALRSIRDLLELERKYRGSVDWPAIHMRLVNGGRGALFRSYLYCVRRLTTVRILPELSFGAREKLHYAVCEKMLDHENLHAWLARADELSPHGLRKWFEGKRAGARRRLQSVYSA